MEKQTVFLLKKPLLLGYTVKDCQNLGYIIKGSTGHRYLAKKDQAGDKMTSND